MNKSKTSEYILPYLKKIRYYLLGLFPLIFFILFFFYYFKDVAIYEPITIRISGLSWQELKTIEVYRITPLNRKISIEYNSDSTMVWQSNSGFNKTIDFIIPDSVSKKITGIEISINKNIYNTKLYDFKCNSIDKYKHNYQLPPGIRNEKSFFKMIGYMMYWFDVILFLKLLLAITIILFLLRKKLKRLVNPVLSVLPFLKSDKKKFQLVKWINTKTSYFEWIKIILISIIIACSLFYGYLFFKYKVSTFITAVLFILYSGLALWLLILVVAKLFKVSDVRLKKTYIGFILFLFIWFSLESILRLGGTNISYNEKIGSYYSSGFSDHYVKENHSGGLMVHPKYYNNTENRKEFAYETKCNVEGLRDIDHSFKKDSGEYRIICLGNSFTEGIGSPQDSTWPKLLEERLKLSTEKKITVFNAGMSGSDPFFEYTLLERKLLKYNPDYVLVALGSSDFEFYRFRGGFERFTAGGCHYRKAPCWEGFYALSYIFRFFINNILKYESFMSPSELKADNIRATKDIEDCISRFNELSVKHHFNLGIMFIDDGDNKYNLILKKLKEENIVTVFDMFEYNKKIEKMAQGDRCKYYWTTDGHCNSKGYALMAKGVEWYLNKNGIIDTLR